MREPVLWPSSSTSDPSPAVAAAVFALMACAPGLMLFWSCWGFAHEVGLPAFCPDMRLVGAYLQHPFACKCVHRHTYTRTLYHWKSSMALVHPPDTCWDVTTCANGGKFQLIADNALKHAVFGSMTCTVQGKCKLPNVMIWQLNLHCMMVWQQIVYSMMVWQHELYSMIAWQRNLIHVM